MLCECLVILGTSLPLVHGYHWLYQHLTTQLHNCTTYTNTLPTTTRHAERATKHALHTIAHSCPKTRHLVCKTCHKAHSSFFVPTTVHTQHNYLLQNYNTLPLAQNLKWCLWDIVSYALVGLSTLIILLYALQFPSNTQHNWLLSSWLSVLQDILFSPHLSRF